MRIRFADASCVLGDFGFVSLGKIFRKLFAMLISQQIIPRIILFTQISAVIIVKSSLHYISANIAYTCTKSVQTHVFRVNYHYNTENVIFRCTYNI